MKTDYLLNTIEMMYKELGNSLYNKNYEFIRDYLNTNENVISINDIILGKFYFMLYNITGKTSNMEKFNPILAVDYVDRNGTRMLYGLSINFIPVNVRVNLFNTILNHNLDILEKNEDLDVNKQYELKNINFASIYSLIKSIGFEWALREFDMKLVNRLTEIDTKMLPQFITMSTVKFTGVNDNKLGEIWAAKLKNREQREKDMIAKLLGDYEMMRDELNKNIDITKTRNENLEKTYSIINKIYK